MRMDWSEAGELQCMIESALSGIVGNCSLLIVSLMSHGCRGVLRGSDGEEIPVNDILHQFTYTLPEYVPLVCHCFHSKHCYYFISFNADFVTVEKRKLADWLVLKNH